MARTMNQKINDGCSMLNSLPDFLTKTYDLLVDLRARVVELETLTDELHDDPATFKTNADETKTAVDELVDDHATFKTVVDELTAWAEALGTKLNADTGVNDTDYDAVITADAPATQTASKPTAGPAELSASKITSLTNSAPSDPDA